MIMNCNILRNIAMSVALLAATDICAQTYWGYANEKTCSYRTGKRFNTGAEQGFAIKVSKEKAALLKGHKLTGIRALFSTSSNTSNIKAFVASELGGTNICEQEVVSIKPRFTDYSFSEPYTITGESDLYAGFTLNYSSDVTNIFSVDWSPELPSGLVWAFTGSGWENVTCNGAPAFFLILDGAPVHTDIMVKPVAFNPFYTAGTAYDFNVDMVNLGTQSITSADITFKAGNGTTVTQHHDGLSIEPGASTRFVFNSKITDSGLLPITLTATNINGGTDADNTDNATTSEKYIYPENTRRRILLETFTGLDCPNCPGGSANISQVISGREDDFVIIAHHTFGGTYGNDFFSMAEDNAYKWFFNGKQYAPGVMANRTPHTKGLNSPVVEATMQQYVQNVVDGAMLYPPYVDINLKTTFNADTRLLTATVRVTTLEDPPYNTNRLNVHLTQSGVSSETFPQSGAGSNYMHNHIFRGSLTGTWGEDIELKAGQTVERTYTYTVPDAIVSTFSIVEGFALPVVLNNMRVVAFIEGITESPADCPIYNTVETALTGGDTGINGNTATSGNVTSTKVYNMQGALVNEGRQGIHLKPGIYIIRSTMANGNTITRKTIIR